MHGEWLGFLAAHWDDMVPDLDVSHALADALDDTSSLVAEHDRESALGILSRQRVRVLFERGSRQQMGNLSVSRSRMLSQTTKTYGVAETSVEDLDADLILLGWADLDVLDGQGCIAVRDGISGGSASWRPRRAGCFCKAD